MGKYHSELLMRFNLAFLMKCEYENLFALIRLHLSKKNNPLLIFTFLKLPLRCILIF